MAIHVLTNDVTTQAWWDGPPVQALLSATAPPVAAMVGRMLRVWLDYRSNRLGRAVTGTCPHDALTIAEAAGRSFVRYARGLMTVHDDGTTSFVPSPNGRHLLGVNVDAAAFISWLSERIGRR